MSDTIASPPEDQPPTPTLSRGMLTLSLILVSTLPIGIVAFLWYMMPADPYPPLDVKVELALAAGEIDPATGEPSPFPHYAIKNVGERELYRIAVYAKDTFGNRFEFNYDKPMASGETRILDARDLALRTGHTLKEGSPLESMEVSGRLPYGARGLSKFRFENGKPVEIARPAHGR